MNHWSNQSLRQELEALAEPSYQQFATSLIPDCRPMLGVRIPHLRKIARRLAKETPLEYLAQAPEDTFEELMLKGLVIGYLQTDWETLLEEIARFVPKIDNWSICDSFCSSLKRVKEAPDRFWCFLQPYLNATRPFELRFAIVMLLNYYIDDAHLSAVLTSLEGIHSQDYYVKMAIAWAISLCFIRFPEQGLCFLQRTSLDTDSYNKALQKICESRQVDASTKAIIKKMKRK